MNQNNLVQKAARKYRSEGMLSLVNSTKRYIMNNSIPYMKVYIPILSADNYHDTRTDNEFRWSFLKEYLCDQDTCLDIGCASGYFTAKMAGEGVWSLGIDDLSQDKRRLSNARDQYITKKGVGFANWRITPDNVNHLPNVDTILLMTVFHHFFKAFGKSGSRQILECLGNNADILVFEVPGWRWTGRPFKIKAESYGQDTIYKIKNQEVSPFGAQIHPKIGHKLPSGKYDVSVQSERYGSSDIKTVFVESNEIVSEKLRLKFDDDKIELLSSEESDNIDDVIQWYDSIIYDVFGESVSVVDKTLTPYSDEQKNIIYILDSSDF